MTKIATVKQCIMFAAMASCLGAFSAKAEHGEADETHPVGGPVPHYIMHAGDKLPPGATADNVPPPPRDVNVPIPENVMKYKENMDKENTQQTPEAKPVEGVDVPMSHDMGR